MPGPAIAVYGAIDRFNYGDLLFPLLIERALRRLEPTRTVSAVGLRSSDLSDMGALKTRSLRWLVDPENLPQGSSVIVAGGEALAADWTHLAGHLLPEGGGGEALFALASRILPGKLLERFVRRRVQAGWPVPLAPRPRYFGDRVKVIFNAVGGSGLRERSEQWREEVNSALSEAAFASVRDSATLEALGQPRDRVRLVPDCAASIAEEFPAWHLRTIASDPVKQIIEGDRPFLCFQLHRYFSSAKLRAFAGELDELHASLGMNIVLLPIGRASGHSDQISLRKLRAKMTVPAEMPENIGVHDIMALLAHCAVFAGTSLHGTITAMAYARPYAILGKNPKCLAYADTWAPAELRNPLRAKDFGEQIAARLGTARELLDASAAELATKARKGLDLVAAAALGT